MRYVVALFLALSAAAPLLGQERAEGPANEKAQKTYQEAIKYLNARMTDSAVDSFKKAVRAMPEVMQGYTVLGETDFVLMVTARDLEDYEAFTRRFFYENPHIKAFKTSVVIDRLKVGLALPIQPTE